MKKMFIYEPAMCCETGLCGVGVDPELLRVSTVINNLKKLGYEVNRYNLTSAPMEFVKNKYVNDSMKTGGAKVLPITIVEDTVVKSGKYPTNDEFFEWLEVYKQPYEEDLNDNNDDCCGGGCCGGSCC
ncbi:arsenite efflux transporter metallochaperone ArsD [Lachnoclostridium phytofermentans]|uniref:Arsenical resistance operon trans-acting repressor ArsD n=1 Tax=Lachnoclostridium phytofermentans (strain ATCC 700394 / DSM 18823 / ISDg) TaxID=357809 RepID=A9KJA8_LACP7|nr:arsenite efflux transporter metallochaperone ArsD [Lachnoclostridium phytofermentans]ABX42520.1 Arsenical resistance operon trans-acting repressor ArsD [Lachnoclostridium phytofermentans ISDg]